MGDAWYVGDGDVISEPGFTTTRKAIQEKFGGFGGCRICGYRKLRRKQNQVLGDACVTLLLGFTNVFGRTIPGFKVSERVPAVLACDAVDAAGRGVLDRELPNCSSRFSS